jgi:hypothetical protein
MGPSLTVSRSPFDLVVSPVGNMNYQGLSPSFFSLYRILTSVAPAPFRSSNEWLWMDKQNAVSSCVAIYVRKTISSVTSQPLPQNRAADTFLLHEADPLDLTRETLHALALIPSPSIPILQVGSRPHLSLSPSLRKFHKPIIS